MKLKRKLYVSPDYYKGLTEAQKSSLIEARKNLAKKYYRDRKGYRPGKDGGDKSYKSLRNRLVSDLSEIEKLHRSEDKWDAIDSWAKKERQRINNTDRSFETKAKRFKEALEIKNKREKLEAEEIAKKAAAELRDKRKKLVSRAKTKKALTKGALIVGGTAIGVGLGAKVIKDSKEAKKQRLAKEAILK